ncbi:DUF1836 domain-containing protein [Enterococcus sp. DIV0242_7C1]|uniref:Fatty acid-binding protein DegV n=1 Tax=Candidatus Enterococcus dunnyi TaxID=1834192 RepID=A0A200JAN6_9ENTE|nr:MULTISPECIES: DUF1836 domain-containing protein [unclassified Enterococcus]MBO0471419.1 DUF1836 domain-containing protein [Enterococcus sp. DIV0242_7C1]MCA5013424.1 DUF1836 domain-containing protein [Enterococcus sp. S23]MCA5016674.1 DUF1836 domain-containing protein [Enterococcus sp. S22(2020)]OUZ33647.1 hypothetical protein A5889_002362 [Enterococcus sp. 9D6_DIV0238]
MNNIKSSLQTWGEELVDVHLPRWHELPEIDLYMDQVITLVERYLSPIILKEKHTLLTSSMVNNYVKLGLIPAPQKKRYNQKHLAFLIAITLLKQVLTIPEIKQGILYQGSAVGIREAYDLFCDEQEAALAVVISQAIGKQPIAAFDQPITVDYLAVKGATLSFATKLFTEKVIELEQKYLEENGEQTYE